MKQTLTALLLVGAVSVLAHLYVLAQSYYPVVRVKTPEGLTLTAVHEPTSERAACGEANHRFLAPFKAMCKDCRVVLARCERELEQSEAALVAGTAIANHRVIAPGVKVAIAGPEDTAKEGCNTIVQALEAQGIASVACIAPAKL